MRAITRMKYNSKCAVSGEYLTGNNGFPIYHIISKKNDGKDEIDNLVLLKSEIHTKLHSKEANELYKTNKIYQNLLKTISRFK